ncbi:DinB family protein [Nocardiopsis sediminis]|uniref:DinB family protein n=1 Tax=Nocardiopsis sediminis TaxID=1778267 RepID=A0ABV8FK06_9ACTN
MTNTPPAGPPGAADDDEPAAFSPAWTPSPVEARVLGAATGAERETLEAFLDYLRDAVVRKISGVSEEDARRRLVPSHTTLAGMLPHLILVEKNWFHRTLTGRTRAEIGIELSDPDDSWAVPEGATVASLIAEYERVCARSREIAAGYKLDDHAPHEEVGDVSLRWILVHMIEETGRHAGHLDILREQLDGAKGQ